MAFASDLNFGRGPFLLVSALPLSNCKSAASLSNIAILTGFSSDRSNRSATVCFTGAGKALNNVQARSACRWGVGFGSVTALSAAKSVEGVDAFTSSAARFDAGPSPALARFLEGFSSFTLSSSLGLDMISIGTEREPRIGASAGPATRMKRWFWWCELKSLMRTFRVAASPEAISSIGLLSSASSNNGTCRFMFLDWLKKPTWMSPDVQRGSTSGSVAAS